MNYSSDFKRMALDALRGRWLLAVAAGLVAALLDSADSGGVKINLDIEDSGASAGFEVAGQRILSVGDEGFQEAGMLLAGGAAYIILAALLMAAVFFVLGSIIRIGYHRFNLELIDRKNPSFEMLFQYFPHWKTAFAARLLESIYIVLWSLLLVIPGIVASYSYAMTGYILAENPELSAGEAITQSKEMMYGHRWRLFCLHWSFIGWEILSILTLGVGSLWLRPYKQAAAAAFYREVSGTGRPDPGALPQEGEPGSPEL